MTALHREQHKYDRALPDDRGALYDAADEMDIDDPDDDEESGDNVIRSVKFIEIPKAEA